MKHLSILLLVGSAMCLLPIMTGCASSAPNSGHPPSGGPPRPYIDPAKISFTDSKGVVHYPSQATLDAVKKLNALRDKQNAQAHK
jgi:hypothetical protein